MDAAESAAEWRRELAAAARAARAELTPAAREQLLRFLEELLRWRATVALVSQRTGTEIIAKHIEDSFAVARLVRPDWRLAVDLGAGAGFPGMVLAILHPRLKVHLVESRRRKASFLRAAARAASVENAHVVQARAETLAEAAGLRARCDLVVSRAVWPLPAFLALASPLLRPAGFAVAMKGRGWKNEIAGKSAEELVFPGYAAVEAKPYRLRAGEERWLLIARRTGAESGAEP